MNYPVSEHAAEAFSTQPIPTVEDEHPWLRLLYAVAIVATIAVSALLSGCGGGDPEDDDAGRSGTQPVTCAAGVCK